MRRRNLIEVLLVEDNPGDASVVRAVFGEAKSLNRVHHAENGLDAVRFLRKDAPYQGVPTPHLILLDLSLPGMDGRDVLAEIKRDASLRGIPVMILTSSRTQQDILRCHEEHANCFISKPEQAEDLARAVRTAAQFWLDVVTLPGG
ncbi:MAG: response regulator [Magnetospirillum sp. WYHS-4]